MKLDFETLEKIEKSFNMIEKRFGNNVGMKRAVLAEYGVDLDLFPTVFEPYSNGLGKQITKQQQENETRAVELRDKMIYGDKWFVLQNRLVNAISDLELNERRLIMFLSPMVRKDVEQEPFKQKRIFRVNVLDYAKEFGLDPKNAYRMLEKTADEVVRKAFFYWDFDGDKRTNKVGVSWFIRCEYKEKTGFLDIELPDDVIEMLTVFDKANPFTKFEIDILVKLGSYGIILYEMIFSCLFQKYKTKTYTINYLREKFNCTETYPLLAEFKRNVIDRAIKEIHTYTPIRIEYTQNKIGRIVNELVFTFEDTSKRDEDTLDVFNSIKMTDKQRYFFANKLAELDELGRYAPIGASIIDYANKIADDLLDSEKAEFYRPYLVQVGFLKKEKVL